MTRINLKKINKPKKIKMKKFFDTRGFFQEIFLKKSFNLDIKFTALAKSKKNVIRGLHFQLRNKQTKLGARIRHVQRRHGDRQRRLGPVVRRLARPPRQRVRRDARVRQGLAHNHRRRRQVYDAAPQSLGPARHLVAETHPKTLRPSLARK